MTEKHTLSTCPKCGRLFEQDQPWKKVCLPCWLKTKKGTDYTPPSARSLPAPPPTIDPTMLRRLLQCCHPDRHDGSEASRLATQWLLQQRGGQHG